VETCLAFANQYRHWTDIQNNWTVLPNNMSTGPELDQNWLNIVLHVDNYVDKFIKIYPK
jgi:hypothetical protein